MARSIIKIVDDREKKSYYMEWSSIVDAPVTYGMSKSDFKEYYRNEYGESGMENFDDRMKRVEKHGTSSFDDMDSLFSNNKAGDNETSIDKEGILEKYCRGNKTGKA